jgi:hypothetical protein
MPRNVDVGERVGVEDAGMNVEWVECLLLFPFDARRHAVVRDTPPWLSGRARRKLASCSSLSQLCMMAQD